MCVFDVHEEKWVYTLISWAGWSVLATSKALTFWFCSCWHYAYIYTAVKLCMMMVVLLFDDLIPWPQPYVKVTVISHTWILVHSYAMKFRLGIIVKFYITRLCIQCYSWLWHEIYYSKQTIEPIIINDNAVWQLLK